jgi:hypothetical protein
MRMSRVLLAGVAVAATAAATSAFTASNTGVDNHVAGYDEAVVSGATITSIDYVRNATDAAIIDSIVFVATEDVDQQEAWLQFRDGTNAPQGAAIQCVVGTYVASTTITCPMPANKPIASVVGIGLTVAA